MQASYTKVDSISKRNMKISLSNKFYKGIELLPESGNVNSSLSSCMVLVVAPAICWLWQPAYKETYPLGAFLIPEGFYPFDGG